MELLEEEMKTKKQERIDHWDELPNDFLSEKEQSRTETVLKGILLGIIILTVCYALYVIATEPNNNQICVPPFESVYLPLSQDEPIVVVMSNTPQHKALATEIQNALTLIQKGGQP